MSGSRLESDIDIQALIQTLAPLNNTYRAAVRGGRASGAEVLEMMWDVGETLLRACVRKPDPVAWAMYGRPGEPRRSYITRDFTCSCFRVRKYFPQRSDIKRQFPGLPRHNLFKLALPLLDSEKYALAGAERERLIALLNSGGPPPKTRREILAMKRAKIAPRSPRVRTGPDIDRAAGQVVARHADLIEITTTRNRRRLNALRRRVGDDKLLFLSKLCLSLFSDEFRAPDPREGEGIPGRWGRFYLELAPVASGTTAGRNRLRRKTGSTVLMEMAEILSAARNGCFADTTGLA